MSEKDKVTRFPISQASRAREVPAEPVPPGKLEMVVNYLQMRARPAGLQLPQRAEALSIIRARAVRHCLTTAICMTRLVPIGCGTSAIS